MSTLIEIKVPELGESVSEATIASWLKKAGDTIETDQTILELETDKVTLEVNAPAGGILKELKVQEGDTVHVGDIVAILDSASSVNGAGSDSKKDQASEIQESSKATAGDNDTQAMTATKAEPDVHLTQAMASEDKSSASGPAAKKIAEEKGIDLADVSGSGKDGRVTKGDLLSHQTSSSNGASEASFTKPQAMSSPQSTSSKSQEERVKMTRLRKTIAGRLKEAQNTAAMLTTFNEVDMTAVMEARKNYKELFEKKHKVKLGFMSFFVKACVCALKEIPAVNAEIDGEDIVYKNHYDIGVAVSTPNGLVVPVVRGADHIAFDEVEKVISDLGRRGRDGKLSMQELQGGTFTITNGGIFGSLMSTPILNPPQSAILGMHKIQERPMVIDGEIKIRPMMYLALTYDHRLIDGREAVTFLVRIKECIENPERLMLNV